MAAAGRGRDAEVSALLANGADVLLKSKDGSTAAGWAAKCVSCFTERADPCLCRSCGGTNH